MLKSHLSAIPHTKFILLEDSLENRGQPLLQYIITHHLNRFEANKLYYFVFEGCLKKTKNCYGVQANSISFYDFIKNGRKWVKDDGDVQKFEDIVFNSCDNNCVVIIDSLANFVLRYGVSESYKIFNTMKNNTGVVQILAVLHKDLLGNDPNYANTAQYFKHLSTLSIELEPKFRTNNDRVQYIYKKNSGKVIKAIEEYRLQEGELYTEKIEKPDPKKLIEVSVTKEVNPETMSTFRIGLTDKEKLSRDKLVLPYLPKAEDDSKEASGGKITYNFDEIDDWDEEDPDDDLDI